MADFPLSLPTFGSDEVDSVDYNLAAHINKLRQEVYALAQEIGTRSSGVPTIGSNVAALLTEVDTLGGYFDGSGKLPHNRIESYQDPQDFTSISDLAYYGAPYATPKWYVDGGGICHWQGFLQLNFPAGVYSGILLAGAPAPYDAAEHTFGVRFGKANAGGSGLGANAALIPVGGYGVGSGFNNVFANYVLASYSIEPSGWVNLRGLVTATSTYGVTAGVCAADGVPRPGDGFSQIIPVMDMGGPSNGNAAIGASNWTTGGNGPLGIMRTMAVLPNGAIVTGPLGSNASGDQPYWYAGHYYSIQGGYQGPIPASIEVLPDGRGQVSSPASTPYGGGFVSLDGISYRVA